MRWRIRRIVNGCAAQQLVARQDVIASEFISYGLVIQAADSFESLACRSGTATYIQNTKDLESPNFEKPRPVSFAGRCPEFCLIASFYPLIG
jgi:hypothetical protein